MKISSIIITGLFAGAAGAIAATLFAPTKGSKTRSRIAKKGQKYKDSVKDNLNEFTDTISHPFEDIEDKTIRISQKAFDKAKKVKAEVSQKLNS
ncbi:YtxH domain-containing protein [Balneolaceae bacterium YR4-1]|uniref:YtxH domain-containing protein n=1 Tax=Halalkalibaculum roseum TaxID=2709311 RepID=A0A6M1SK19_9BACT|nr:YtxH domain-containing protein [Halalkalibaculum roseum]NGP75641.1 YtxH domain-containing protein [Halalkalibaculum roseum]